MKKWIIIVVLLAAGASGFWMWRRAKLAKPAEAAPTKTAKLARGNIDLYVEATGSVESNLDVEVKSKASGEIISLPYDVSERVPKYEPGKNEDKALLAALDPVNESRQVERAQAARDAAKASTDQAAAALAIARENFRVAKLQAQASVESAQAKADMDELLLKHQKELVARGATNQAEVDNAEGNARISRAQLDQAKTQTEALRATELTIDQRQAELDLAKANMASAESSLADARQRLDETKIYSPIDGVVTRRDVQVGQIIASGIVNVAGGTSLLTVSDMSRVFVVTEVHESDIGRLVETGRLSQDADITADAYPGRRFRGKVVQITPRGISDAKVINFNVKVEVVGEGKELLLPKMTADVRILANATRNALLLPNQCLHYDRDQAFVEIKCPQGFARKPVKLGLNDGTQAEVLEGLCEGDEVAQGSSIVSHWLNATAGTATTQPGAGQPKTDEAKAPPAAPPAASTRESQP